jgi:hypothetical protein
MEDQGFFLRNISSLLELDGTEDLFPWSFSKFHTHK